MIRDQEQEKENLREARDPQLSAGAREQELPEMDFSTLILSLTTSAMLDLGLIEGSARPTSSASNPMAAPDHAEGHTSTAPDNPPSPNNPPPASNTGAKSASLTIARQTIRLIEILEEKTRGNLTGEEERLICQVLAELQGHVDQYHSESKGQRTP